MTYGRQAHRLTDLTCERTAAFPQAVGMPRETNHSWSLQSISERVPYCFSLSSSKYVIPTVKNECNTRFASTDPTTQLSLTSTLKLLRALCRPRSRGVHSRKSLTNIFLRSSSTQRASAPLVPSSIFFRGRRILASTHSQ